MEFSDKIKYVRDKLELSQEELAKELKVSFATVNRWEQGNVVPHNSTSLKLDEFCKNKNINFEEEPNINNGLNLITARQIENWFSLNQRDSQGSFPELIERLIIECNKSNFNRLRFPSKDKINLDGFDGEVDCDNPTNLFIPHGKSVWELGATTINSTTKIKQDYEKRSKHTSMAQKKSSTFVLVTPKSFSSSTKNNLRSYFNKQGWKNVIIYDAVDLELWLSQCLNTSIWVFEKFTNQKIDIESFETAYTEFMTKTTPELKTSLFTINRDEERQLFFNSYKTSKVIKVSSASLEESFGFIMSVMKETNDENLLSKVIVCKNYSSMLKIDALTKDKILILTTPIANHNTSKNNQFIFIFGKDTTDHIININLKARPQSCLMDILKNEMRVPTIKLNEISHKAKNNIMLIMREIENETSHTSNNWRNDPEIDKLIPILMLGKVDLKNETDKGILSSFLPGRTDLDSYITFLRKWEKRDNSPLFFYGDIIKVSLKEELWESVKDLITPKVIDILTKTVKDIFKTVDPKFKLPVDKRIAHQLYQKTWKYNKHIINGLLDSCILLTIYNNEQTKIDILIREVLSNISSSDNLLTLSDSLSLIAECSPDEFLKYIEKEVKNDKSYIFSLFLNNNTSIVFGAGHEYCNLLWSLELLTHINETKIRACNVLMTLKLKGFSYKISNSPTESLLNSLHWLNRKNALTFDDKKNVVIKFIRTYKNQAFDIVFSLISANSIMLSNAELRWRNPDLIEENLTNGMIYSANEEYIKAILDIIELSDVETIKKIINLHFHLTKKSLDDIRDFIQNNFSCEKEGSVELYEYLLCKRYSIIKYSKENKDEYVLNMCENIINIIKPKDMLQSSLIYFKHFGYSDCPIPETINEDFEAEEKKVRKYQSELFKQLYSLYNPDEVIEKIVSVLPNNGVDGYFFAQQNLSSKDVDLVIKAAKELKKFHFLVSFLSSLGTGVYEKFINEQNRNLITELIPFIHNIPIVPKVILQDEELTKLLYKHREIHKDTPANDMELIKLHNPMSYVRNILYNVNVEDWDIADITKVLSNINESHIRNSTDCYYLREIFSKLDQNYDNEEILKLEIKFFNIFEYDELPNGIKKYLFNNPEEYILLIDSINTDEKINMSMWYKLNMHMTFPTNFKSEPSKIDRFISVIMNYANPDQNRVSILRSNLGSILARSFGLDKAYFIPHDLKDIIEKLADDKVNTGIIIGYENMRGARTVSDGTPELKLSEQYELEAKENSILFPETSKILRALSQNRKFDAERDKQDRMLIDGLL